MCALRADGGEQRVNSEAKKKNIKCCSSNVPEICMVLNPTAFDVTHQWNWELRPLELHEKSVAKAELWREEGGRVGTPRPGFCRLCPCPGGFGALTALTHLEVGRSLCDSPLGKELS